MRIERSHFGNVELFRAGESFYPRPRGNCSVHNSHEADNALEVIVITVEDKRFERRVVVALRRRNEFHYLFENLIDVDSVFCGNSRGVRAVESDNVLDFLSRSVGVGGGEVDFVDYGYYFQIVVESEIAVRERLRFDALRCVYDENSPFARGERTRNFVSEVHVSRGIDKVEDIFLSVFRLVSHSHGREFYGDSAFSFQVHRVEELVFHISFGNLTG